MFLKVFSRWLFETDLQCENVRIISFGGYCLNFFAENTRNVHGVKRNQIKLIKEGQFKFNYNL